MALTLRLAFCNSLRRLKRYLARRLFKLLEASPTHAQKEKIATT
jgi:hypothetical protein